ncbi:hypothetical protein LJC63_13015 [Ruminococcaceae bacterium OttesenSCG-928-L11]|nr:hypothetical protein [Ruminococcaceae bacterium OttesenSCG-928-L11]
MKQRHLFQAIGSVDADLIEEAATSGSSRPALRVIAARWGAAAACLALIVGLALARMQAPPPQLLPQLATEAEPRAMILTLDSPAGIRKILNYNGYRYAFAENGSPYDFSAFRLETRLGVLEHDIMAGMDGQGENTVAAMDFAATFAIGGVLYEIPGYNPAFRLAVEWDGRTYLAEAVGKVDNTPMDAASFFEAGDIRARIVSVAILAHSGGEPLQTVERKQTARDMVELLAKSTPAELTGDDYSAIATAQWEGRSWQMQLSLNDGTAVSLYVMPDLGYVSIGDEYYRLPDTFQSQYGPLFEGLTQSQPPLE